MNIDVERVMSEWKALMGKPTPTRIVEDHLRCFAESLKREVARHDWAEVVSGEPESGE